MKALKWTVLMLDKLLKSAFEMCENANKIDYGLHQKQKRFSFWLYSLDKFKTEFKLLFRI